MGSQRSTLCLVPIVSNNKEYHHENEFFCCILSLLATRNLAKVLQKTCIRAFFDVSRISNFSHESIDYNIDWIRQGLYRSLVLYSHGQ